MTQRKGGSGGIDFHCHLDLFSDPLAAIACYEQASIYALTVTTTPRAWPRNREMTIGTRFVRAALGLHPQLVGERAAELAIWKSHLPGTRYVGEVGLDAGPRYFPTFDLQRQIFADILEACAEQGGKILSVHSARCASLVLDLVEKHLPPTRGRVVLHWFTGSQADVRRAAAMGCYFSVNGRMFETDRQRRVVAAMPRDRILTETDGPFAQGQRHGVPSTRDLATTVEALATLHAMDVGTFSQTLWANLRRLLATDVGEEPQSGSVGSWEW